MWIIFYNEHTLQHYLYNGAWPIGINPVNAEPWFGDDIETPVGKQQLDAAMVPKTRTFTVNKKKYRIIARGYFVNSIIDLVP